MIQHGLLQEEQQLADGLVHEDPEEVCLAHPLVHGGVAPCQLHTFLNIGTLAHHGASA